MDITRSEQILVIILATTLAVLLILAIIATIKFIQVMSDIKRITKKTSVMADKAESMIDNIQTTTASIKIVQLLTSLFSKADSKK